MKLTPVPSPVYTVKLDGVTVPYTIRRSARAKHIRITISAHNGVVVTFPSRMRRYVNPDDFLREKKEWVLKHLEKTTLPPIRTAPLENGTRVNLRGREYQIRLCRKDVSRPKIDVAGDELVIALPPTFSGELKETVRAWIKKQAGAAIQREALLQAERIGVTFTKVTVRDQKTKWGSCSRKGNLSFNWRLILFPPNVLRYVVIHELCHIRHFNHSPRFWALVEQYDPRYKESILWLKNFGMQYEGALR